MDLILPARSGPLRRAEPVRRADRPQRGSLWPRLGQGLPDREESGSALLRPRTALTPQVRPDCQWQPPPWCVQAYERRHAMAVPVGPPEDIHPVQRRAAASPAALGLLAQAHSGLEEAAALEAPHERYATAHLAALRTAAAVLAVRGRPEQNDRRRRRIRSVWEVLPEIAPELAEWSALFAA